MVTELRRMQQRRDSAANWSSENPVLLSGEIGIEIVAGDPDRWKVGDGATAWNSLDYQAEAEPLPTRLGAGDSSDVPVLTDLDDVYANGWYRYAGGADNAPPDDEFGPQRGVVFVSGNANDGIYSEWVWSDAFGGSVWFRGYSDGGAGWTSWKPIKVDTGWWDLADYDWGGAGVIAAIPAKGVLVKRTESGVTVSLDPGFATAGADNVGKLLEFKNLPPGFGPEEFGELAPIGFTLTTDDGSPEAVQTIAADGSFGSQYHFYTYASTPGNTASGSVFFQSNQAWPDLAALDADGGSRVP